MDVIELRGLRVKGRHGVLAHEREQAQPFEIDVRLELDLHDASATDEIGATVDYATLAQRITEIVQNKSFALLERLGGEILQTIFADPRVAQAEVAIRKPAAIPNGTPVVRLRRANPRLA